MNYGRLFYEKKDQEGPHMKLYRVSEEPDIREFIPGLPARADMNRNIPLVRRIRRTT